MSKRKCIFNFPPQITYTQIYFVNLMSLSRYSGLHRIDFAWHDTYEYDETYIQVIYNIIRTKDCIRAELNWYVFEIPQILIIFTTDLHISVGDDCLYWCRGCSFSVLCVINLPLNLEENSIPKNSINKWKFISVTDGGLRLYDDENVYCRAHWL